MDQDMRPRRSSTLLALVVVLTGLAVPASRAEEPEYEMVEYQFVFFKSGDTEIQGQELQRLQGEHLELLEGLVKSDKAIVVGPLEEGQDYRGVAVLDVGSVEAAREVLAADPFVSKGHMELEIHPWWAAKGIFRKPPKFLDLGSCWLGLLIRPPNAPEISDERAQEIQAGHMANIGKMADSGDLVIAGPMGDDGVLRGIFVFRTDTVGEIKALVADDPAFAAGRLVMELYKWRIPKGAIPDR